MNFNQNPQTQQRYMGIVGWDAGCIDPGGGRCGAKGSTGLLNFKVYKLRMTFHLLKLKQDQCVRACK